MDFNLLPMAGDPDCRRNSWRCQNWFDLLPDLVRRQDVRQEEIAMAGMLVLHPSCHMRGNVPIRIRRQANDTNLRRVHRIIRDGPADHWDAAIGEAIRAVFNKSDESSEPVYSNHDIVQVHAVARLGKQGHDLIDTSLISEIQQPWRELSEHILQTRSFPRLLLGSHEISRKEGKLSGVTAVRPRLPNDELIEILPSDWALMQRNRKAGLDKILNRDALVYSRENPIDRVPQPRVLLAFVINSRSYGAHIAKNPAVLNIIEVNPITRLKALVHRLVMDVARQTPFDVMEVHVAIYVKDFEPNAGGDGNTVSPTTSATCFDLGKADLLGENGLVRFDELIPFYLATNPFQAVVDKRPEGKWPALSDDPWRFISTCTASISTYTGVLAVVVSDAEHWHGVLPQRDVALRPLEAGRAAGMLIESDDGRESRRFRFSCTPTLEPAVASAIPKLRSSDLEPREALLDMVLGPVQADAHSANRPIVLNEDL